MEYIQQYSSDTVVFDKDTLIISTGKHAIIYIKNGVIDKSETEMWSVQWWVFNFNCQIPTEEQRDISPCRAVPCPKCFFHCLHIFLFFCWVDDG